LFYKAEKKGFKEVLPGIKLKTLVYGEKTLFAEFRMGAGAVLPKHAHIHEQTGYLTEGKIRLTIGKEPLKWKRETAGAFPATWNTAPKY